MIVGVVAAQLALQALSADDEELDFPPQSWGAVYGHVFDRSGRGVPNAEFSLERPDGDLAFKAGPLHEIISGDNGMFEIPLPPGEYLIYAYAGQTQSDRAKFRIEKGKKTQIDLHFAVDLGELDIERLPEE